MILQALADYYIRESKRKQSRIAPYGMEKKEIKFIIEIDENGDFVNLIDTRTDGKNGKIILVPKSIGRSGSNSWQTANLLWDHYGYVLGQSQFNKDNINASGQNESFITKLESLPKELKENREISAVRKFYKGDGVRKVLEHQNWPKCHKIPGCNLTFQLDDESVPVTENVELRRWLSTQNEEPENFDDKTGKIIGRCLVTGEVGEIARTHSKVRIGGNQATLVGFQKDSGYDSYGKEQGYNAPISQKAQFYYVTALNTLLNSEYNRMNLGDVVLLFWTAPKILTDETAEKAEKGVKLICSSLKDNANLGTENVKNIFESIFTGKIPSDVGDRFYILGLSPNKARISVVFWKNGSIKEIAQNILQYFKDIEIIKNSEWRDITFRDILSSSEYKGKVENVPSNMIPALIYSVFNGTPYPSALFGHIMERVRAERNPTVPRVAFIKAYLNRKYKNIKGVEIIMDLDRENVLPSYRLGRLFAVLEKIQEEANPGINATIRDRFYGAMSSCPASVFPILIRLMNYHLEKLVVGRKINLEREIMEIFSSLQPETMPKHLSLEEQGYFAIGYYHERQYLYTKKEN
ncbi:MAG: type I-C CRISPR-associated protein Cas8c/Csd1 [Clostridia bacterium]|uniref:type I-C CRISPR-associated protein Cas8c/Csd1 n=1 Tax=Cloacibacillus porcorum TaxID=1197717 RepID=UPI002357DDE3|nr:type I-C CRISPR-associated protein Cas8c/Csd1 [Cloacibacillus porcorum]MCI5863661.1 type I-C CRISPR-associated protein Cas8c/Csd1 [Cloacibacillus porcorum]MCI7303520.1 type I-C CRISPR-associated protein Cas8c/Csd1 [Clostridia bacterium]